MRLIYTLILSLFFFSFGYSADKPFLLFSGNANQELSKAIANSLEMELSPITVSRFSDGEIKIKVDADVRAADIFLIQPICTTETQSVNDSLMELYLMIRTMKRSSAQTITAVIPYYGYARQDRKTESRVPISASDIAMLIELSGADRIICVDLHCGQIQGFFHKTNVDNLSSVPIFASYFANKTDLINPVVVSPDAGGVERAKNFIQGLSWYGMEAGLAIIIKQRAGAGVIDKMNLVGNVNNSDVIIVDDICDTAGTLVHAAKELKNLGARRVFACITHPVFSGLALEKISNSCLTEVVVTNTIPQKENLPPNITPLSIAPLIGAAIHRTYYGESIHSLFTKEGAYLICNDPKNH